MKALKIAAIVIGLWLLAMVALAVVVNTVGSASSAPTPKAQTTDNIPSGYDPTKKAEREKLISFYQSNEIIGKVWMGSGIAKMQTGRRWEQTAFDDKQSVASLVYLWGLDNDRETAGVRIDDANSGKKVGTFSRLGLSLK